MRRFSLLASVALAGALTACQEKLTTPVDCPELCPGNSLIVRDTVIEPIFDLDSTFTGYLRAAEIPALLVSNGLPAGDARSWATFPRRTDSVIVDGLQHALILDSAEMTFRVVGLDKSVTGTQLVVHRISPAVDTNTTLAELDAQLTPESVMGRIAITDTGMTKLSFKGEDLGKIAVFEADSFRLGIGLRLEAPSPTGVRLESLISGSRPPTMTLFGKIAIADTARQRQTLSAAADSANYVINTPPLPGGDRYALGGKRGRRAILRFLAPAALKDSAIILRATLELTPSGPLLGLKGDPATLEVRGVLADVGAKSPYIPNFGASVVLPVDVTDVQSIELRATVATWFVRGAPPSSLVIGINPEGGSFAWPEFFSTRAASGRPRIRITYALPSQPGHP